MGVVLRGLGVFALAVAVYLGWAEWHTMEQANGQGCPPRGKGDAALAARAEAILPRLTEVLLEVTKLRAQKKLDDPVGGIYRRIQHSMDMGCFNASFIVDTPDPANRISIFSEVNQGKHFATTVRMSKNAFDGDADPKVTALAIKIRGLPSDEKRADEKTDAQTGEKDTLEIALVLTETMPLVGEPEELVPIHEYLVWGGIPGVIWFQLRNHHATLVARLIRALFRGKSVTVPPLATHFSIQASAFGENAAVRWRLSPCDANVTMPPAPESSEKSFAARLTEEQFAKGPLCMRLEVQKQRDPCVDRIDNLISAWGGPWEQVGRLVVSKNTAVRSDAACEDLSFNPWRAPAALAPLGWVATIRRHLYNTLATARIAHNHNQH